jgi:predicted amidophosphoribosyltransferase
MTTGATIKYAALALKKAGAKHIWVAIIAKQPNR